MLVQDGGSPPRERTGILTVDMLRNLNEPKFDEREYRETILETHSIGSEVIRIEARDSDEKVFVTIGHSL